MASALSFLHKHGLTHRDVKPPNIIFVGGVPKLADIGLVTDGSAVETYVGTEGFIPPEGSGSAPADIYALGKVLYEISTGNDRHAYPELPAELGNRVEQCDFVELNRIILKACRANPKQRYASADAMLLALLNFQFNANALRRERRLQVLTKVAAIVGATVAFGVVVGVVWRLIWLSQHGF
jgi:serine/threonine protein kinase